MTQKLDIIDINCDLGEGEDIEDCAQDALLMPYISRCNIACGGHAGNSLTMHQSLLNAKQHQLLVGAHPSYADRENFGRLSLECDWSQLSEMIIEQVEQLIFIAAKTETKLSHIKLHGALYHDIEKNPSLAEQYVLMVKQHFPNLEILGLANGEVSNACNRHEVPFISEGFIDRAYTNQGQLVPRAQPGAVYDEPQNAITQAISFAKKQPIHSIDNQPCHIHVDSLCLHSDTPNALQFAKALHAALIAKDMSCQD
ncbi:5-oxoprolinase subunit PxpA [Aliikangiella maris]|uniref:5-oxoprolinase subunit PxpA n=2 Tax=Aliikangiella maris TaxID=3162458 RepID=A0ABV2BQ03_9GAMM